MERRKCKCERNMFFFLFINTKIGVYFAFYMFQSGTFLKPKCQPIKAKRKGFLLLLHVIHVTFLFSCFLLSYMLSAYKYPTDFHLSFLPKQSKTKLTKFQIIKINFLSFVVIKEHFSSLPVLFSFSLTLSHPFLRLSLLLISLTRHVSFLFAEHFHS